MTAPNRADLGRAVLFWSAVADEAKTRAGTARAALDDDARAEFAATGAAPTWRIPDIGTIPLALTTASVVVDDAEAYAKWVESRHPTKVETVTRVLDGFDVPFRRALAERGEPLVDDEGTVVPGLRFVAGGQPRGVSVRPLPGVRDQAATEARRYLGEPGAES